MKCAPQPYAPPPAARISLTIGTAGHIDHGKTSIVQCLTGCWCDGLPEEKARGMTIDLGFAVWQKPDGRRVGIVDVPGHERFIHNMVAGAAGIDVVMLVVAADDGVMPQTIEHVQIVRMLGVRRGMIVLNKSDLADEERLAFVEEEIRDCVRGTFLEESPIVRFSAKTGAGVDALLQTLERTVDATAERSGAGPFLVHVERAFVLQGIGTILSGIPRTGRVRLGDAVELLPDGTRHIVKGIHVYGQPADTGRAGECAALRLSGVTKGQITRGQVIASPGYFQPSRFLNVKFFYLPHHDRPLEPRTAIRFHIGTSDTTGHLVLPERSRLAPGQETYAQVQLSQPIVSAPGDFFVIRQRSPVKTLGGGTLIDTSDTKLRRGRGDWVSDRAEQEKALDDEAHALMLALKKSGNTPCHIDNWARQAGVSLDAVRDRASELAAQNVVVALPGDRYVAADALAEITDALTARLTALHDAHPLYRGFPKRDILKGMTGARLLMDRAFDDLLADGYLVHEDDRFFLREREPRLSPDEQRAAADLVRRFDAARYATPRPDELPAQTGLTQNVVDELLTHLTHTGVLVSLLPHVFLHRDWMERARNVLVAQLRDAGRIRSADYKDLLDTSRKYAIPLLEYWDSVGLTRRVGDERVLREPKENP